MREHTNVMEKQIRSTIKDMFVIDLAKIKTVLDFTNFFRGRSFETDKISTVS